MEQLKGIFPENVRGTPHLTVIGDNYSFNKGEMPRHVFKS